MKIGAEPVVIGPRIGVAGNGVAESAEQQLLGPWGVTWPPPFYVDPQQAIEWSGYTVELTDPPAPDGDGWILSISIRFPSQGVNSIEVRREEDADSSTGNWFPSPATIGVLIDGVNGATYPTMGDLATALAAQGVTVSNFGNVLSTDMIDGASMIGDTPQATFETE